MSKTGLTHISDRINQWRYVDKDGNEQWLHPVFSILPERPW